MREGQVGDTFYVIADGQVSVTQRIVGFDEPQQIRVLNKGEYFGEKALLTEERRTASVIALKPGVELLTLNRELVPQFILTSALLHPLTRLSSIRAELSAAILGT